MRGIILVIIGLILILGVSYIVISDEPDFVVDTSLTEEDNSIMTFKVGEGSSNFNSGRMYLHNKTSDARKRNLRYEQMEEKIDDCIEKKTKNWETRYSTKSYEKEFDDDKGEWVTTKVFWDKEKSFYGYDEKEHPWLKWRLRNRFLNGEEIC